MRALETLRRRRQTREALELSQLVASSPLATDPTVAGATLGTLVAAANWDLVWRVATGLLAATPTDLTRGVCLAALQAAAIDAARAPAAQEWFSLFLSLPEDGSSVKLASDCLVEARARLGVVSAADLSPGSDAVTLNRVLRAARDFSGARDAVETLSLPLDVLGGVALLRLAATRADAEWSLARLAQGGLDAWSEPRLLHELVRSARAWGADEWLLRIAHSLDKLSLSPDTTESLVAHLSRVWDAAA